MHTVATASTDSSEKEAKVRESLQKAKEAVAMDVKDGTSWSESRCVQQVIFGWMLHNSLANCYVQKCS